MKKLLLVLATLHLFNLSFAQSNIIDSRLDKNQGNKILTMEEAILGSNLSPQKANYLFKGNSNEITFKDKNNIVSYNPKTDKKYELISLEEINKLSGIKLTALPNYSWTDANSFSFIAESQLISINTSSKDINYKIPFPKGSANFSPSGKGLFAYTKGNNLYYCNNKGEEIAITSDSNSNIVNGQSVSRNEFGIDGGIFWSDNGEKLAFYKKDESKVASFPLLNINTRGGELMELKYPMAGLSSEIISLGVYDFNTKKTVFLNVSDFDKERYLTNITWSPCGNYIFIQVLNREQKHMKLNMYSAINGEYVKTILEEKNDKFVEPQNKLVFIKNDRDTKILKFIYRTDNRDGYKNLYLCSSDGNIERLTCVDADVELVGLNDKYLYYTSAELSPIENHLFELDLNKKKVKLLTPEKAWHNIQLSKDCSYFLDTYSSLNVANVIALRSSNLKLNKNLLTSPDPTKDFNYGEIILGTIKSADGKFDNYYRLIKPANFNPNKKYPTIIYVYGGPHSQLVKNTWLGEMRRWEMYMAQRGYVVYVQDNRGTSNRGANFEKAIYGQCGQAEMADQMEGVKMLQSLSYVDKDRIGIHGWSYGGFMTISLITNFPDIFKVAVAGGPVIDWCWYETMYGERYMGSPHTNAQGYKKTSLINKAKDLKGKLLICQGAVDNVVLWQHSLSFLKACISNNVQVDYFPYPNAQHNVIGKDRVHLMNKVTLYFNDYL